MNNSFENTPTTPDPLLDSFSRIKPLFKTAVSEDVFNRDGSLWIPKGSGVAYNTRFQTEKFGKFSMTTPNPVHLFLANVDYLLVKIEEEFVEINASNRIIVFSKLVDGVKKYTTDELLRLDPDADTNRILEEKRVYRYIGFEISCLALLIASVESFVNQELPEECEHIYVKNGNRKVLKKSGIERSLRLEKKIDLLADFLKKEDYKNQDFWKDFVEIKKLRNDFVHMKTRGIATVNRYDDQFSRLLELDLRQSRDSVVSLLNYFIDRYVS